MSPMPSVWVAVCERGRMGRPWRRAAGLALSILLVGACGSDEPTADVPAGISGGRCEANRDVGTVTYVTSFDFAAAASILDAVVAADQGFFAARCLDVEIVPGFAPGNGGVVAAGQAQMSTAGSFGELVNTNVQGDADLVAVIHYGKTAIEELIVPADSPIAELTDLPGSTVGIKGDLPYSLQAMLGLAGVERSSFDEVLLDGFDPVQHLELDIDALPVYKSNEPAQLDAAGVDYRVFDPLDADVPASFAVVFTSRSFLEEHRGTVEDMAYALIEGFEWARENPDAAVEATLARLDATGNQAFLTRASEEFRWLTESQLVALSTPSGTRIGQVDLDRLGAEIELLTEVGVFASLPDWESMVEPAVVDGLWQDGRLVAPGSSG